MSTWLKIVVERLRTSLWFVPGLMTLSSGLLAWLCEALDRAVTAEDNITFLYRGEIESVRTVLSTVAGSMITVAGVAFSVTMVALSLASSQLGPRLLDNFMRDPGNQVVLGGFIATYLFCLLALGSTPLADGDVVSVSVTVALVLAVGSLALLIYFIHHIATTMQADYVIRSVAEELADSLGRVFRKSEDADDAPDVRKLDLDEAGPATDVPVPRKGYIQAIDLTSLVQTAAAENLRVRVRHRPGRYVVSGIPLLTVFGPATVNDALACRLQRAFLIGSTRTAEQDVEYGIHQLVEIALRALSPGINDPYSAMACVDHLSGILSDVASLPERPPFRCDEQGEVRVSVPAFDFVGMLDAGFDQIRQYAVRVPSVSIRLLEALAAIAETTQRPKRLAAIARQAHMVRGGCRDDLLADDDEALEARYRRVIERTEAGAP